MDNTVENENSSITDICDQLKMFKIDKSNPEGDPCSLVYKIFRTKLSPDSLVSSHIHDSQKDIECILGKSESLSTSYFLPEDKALLLSFDPTISPGDLIPEDFSHEQILHSLPEKTRPCIASVKSEENRELRRSPRIALLQARSNFSLDVVKKEIDESTISNSQSLRSTKRRSVKPKQGNARKRKEVNSSNSGVNKKSKLCEQKRTSQKVADKAPSAAYIKRETENTSDKSEKQQLRDPRLMKLKHMVVTQRAGNHNYMGCPCFKLSENAYPKFANVDPSMVISAVNSYSNPLELFPKKRQIALFTTRNKSMTRSTASENENYHYYFKKMQMNVPYLRKKYQMLDTVTLDYYHEMAGYSLRKTEIILQDIIYGNGVIYSKHNDHEAIYSNSALPIFHHYEPYPSQDLDKSSACSSNELFREILVEALKVLHCEEGGSS